MSNSPIPPEGTEQPLRLLLPWEVVEPAARELFRIWDSEHDLNWARERWERFPKLEDADEPHGSDLAHSLVALTSLALISKEISALACDERGLDLTHNVEDAIVALSLNLFFLGQLYPWDAPPHRNQEIDLHTVVIDLAKDRAPKIVQLLRIEFTTPEELLESYLAIRGEPDADGDVFESELRTTRIDEFLALEWVASGCPL